MTSKMLLIAHRAELVSAILIVVSLLFLGPGLIAPKSPISASEIETIALPEAIQMAGHFADLIRNANESRTFRYKQTVLALGIPAAITGVLALMIILFSKPLTVRNWAAILTLRTLALLLLASACAYVVRLGPDGFGLFPPNTPADIVTATLSELRSYLIDGSEYLATTRELQRAFFQRTILLVLFWLLSSVACTRLVGQIEAKEGGRGSNLA